MTLALNLAPATQKITGAWRKAAPQHIADGMPWYQRAHQMACDLDPANPVRAAAVYGVLSAKTSWPMNVDLATLAYVMFNGGESEQAIASQLGTLPANAAKAAAILHGGDIDRLVGGQKVRSFWRTIADPQHPTAVVVDRHAYDIAVGRVTSDQIRSRALGTPKRYEAIAELYRRAAKVISKEIGQLVLPSQVQATTWTYWRETTALAYHGKAA